MLKAFAAATVLVACAALCWIAARGNGATAFSSAAPVVHHAPPQLVPGTGTRIVVLGYVGCATTCPLTLRTVSRAVALIPHSERVDAVFVDVDPSVDTAATVDRFARHFAHVRGFRPTAADAVTIEDALGAAPARRSGAEVDHDARIFLIDAHGAVDTLLPDVTAERLARAVAAR